MNSSSPMLDQYRQIKRDHKEEVLFFRLGDFYEMFEEDALEVSSLLNLTLTSRNGRPMCGVPYHAARPYIARLLKIGKKIAVCEQLSEPQKGRPVLERQVIEVITPGTTVEEDFLDTGSSNYLASLARYNDVLSFAYIDLSAGDFYTTSFPLDDAEEKIRQEFQRLQIRELLVQESLVEENSAAARAIGMYPGLVVNRWADWLFDLERAQKRLEKQFGISNLKSFGLDAHSPQLLCTGALLDYLDDTAKSLIPHVKSIIVYSDAEYLGIDESSQRNLELVSNLSDKSIHFTLLEVMDLTRCSMGRRLLKKRMLQPLRDLTKIAARLDMVETLYRDQGRLGKLREVLGKTPDLERLISRLAMDKAHGKDILAIKNALGAAGEIDELWEASPHHFETETFDVSSGTCTAGLQKNRLMELRDLLERSICDNPSIVLTEGNLIRDSYNPQLDQLRKLKDTGRQMLEDYLEEEKQLTGISSLKIRYNRLIGYFFEVTKNNLSRIPSRFIRRQGTVNGERFSTERLAALESDINGAADKITDLERRLFLEIREQAKAHLDGLAFIARRIAELDCAQSLAKTASIHGWIRPVLDNSHCMEIREARHPVVEAHLGPAEFIPNDIILGSQDAVNFALITGPNMAGKSTYLRSAALIAIMAQMGSFVPAGQAYLGICDRIYCRVGASDNLARGESTFLVEMNETAYILNTATEHSLVIMDEVGRGTGTNDGLSIAWAVSEELLNRIKCRTLFATHYHELSLIRHKNMTNRSMEVLEENGEIIFLRKLKQGMATESYGIHVARLAGLSDAVVKRAQSIMDELRERDVKLGQSGIHTDKTDFLQESQNLAGIVQKSAEQEYCRRLTALIDEIKSVDINGITPLKALEFISKWQQKIAHEIIENPVSRTDIHTRQKPGRDTQNKESIPSLFPYI